MDVKKKTPAPVDGWFIQTTGFHLNKLQLLKGNNPAICFRESEEPKVDHSEQVTWPMATDFNVTLKSDFWTSITS